MVQASPRWRPAMVSRNRVIEFKGSGLYGGSASDENISNHSSAEKCLFQSFVPDQAGNALTQIVRPSLAS